MVVKYWNAKGAADGIKLAEFGPGDSFGEEALISDTPRSATVTICDPLAASESRIEPIVAEMKARISARTHKETQRRKNALESSSLPTKLVDCRTQETEVSELFIVTMGDRDFSVLAHPALAYLGDVNGAMTLATTLAICEASRRQAPVRVADMLTA